MLKKLLSIGSLRVMHSLVLLSLIFTAPFAGGEPSHSGWSMWPSLLAPALAPMFLFVLGLDIMMAAIYRSSSEGVQRAHYTWILKVDSILMAGLVLSWYPFVASLLQN